MSGKKKPLFPSAMDQICFESRSDVVLINMAVQDLTSDRLKGMISTGGQTEAVRPGTVLIQTQLISGLPEP
jgi:hypothetical protein